MTAAPHVAPSTAVARLRAHQNKVFVVLLLIALLYFPAKWALSSWKAASAQVAAAQAQTAQLNAQANSTNGFRWATYNAGIAFYNSEIPAGEDLPGVINDVTALTAQAGLEWTSGAPSAATTPISGGPAGQWTMNIAVQGSANQIVTLLNSLSHASRLIVASSVAMNGPANSMTANITLEFFAQQAGS